MKLLDKLGERLSINQRLRGNIIGVIRIWLAIVASKADAQKKEYWDYFSHWLMCF
jgi:hypothetical protein